MRRNVLLSFLFLFAVFQFVDAQVRGTVNDQDGFAVVDAEVTVRGTEATSITDENGAFEVDAQIGDVLVVTDALGVTKDFSVTKENMGTLSFGAEVLTEAVILGYGISESDEQKTGSYVTVKSEDIEKVGSVSFDQALQGQVAGVNIGAGSGQPGANAQIFVRGITSLTGSSMPLVVVNGVPVTTGDMSGIASSSNPLANIDPSTIENVTVLKDAVATSLYGSRGANGVILVTLKKGKNSKGKFTFNTEFGVGDVAFEKEDWLDAQGHVNFFATALENAYGMTYDETVAELGWDGVTNSDWRNGVRHNAISSQKYVLNYSGGNEQIRLFTSLSYNDQDGIARDANFNRVSGYLGADWTVNDKMGLNFDVTVSKARQTGPSDGSSYSNPIFAGNLMSPTQAIYNTDGSYNLDLYFLNPEFNPMALQERNLTHSDFYKAIINLGGDYDITKDLNFETKFGVDYNFYDELMYWNPDFGDGNSGHPLGNGYGYASQRNFNTWNWSNALRYNKTFADVHNLTLTAGTEAIKYTYSVVVAEKRGYPAGNTKPTLDNAANAGELTNSSGADYSFMSYFGRLAYDFDGKFSVTGNIRRDGSSRFGQNNRWGTFWGVGAAVNINKFINVDAINELKLRGSYGTVGNAEIGNYAFMSRYGASAGQYLGSSAGYTTVLGNPDLKWETTQQVNIGLDLGFLQNRLRASVDLYEKKVKDLLYNIPVNQSGSQGFSVFMGNDGNLTSKGLETTLTVVPIRGEDFEWSITGNYAYNDSEITSLNDGRIAVRNGFKAWQNGHNPTEWYTRLWAGVNQEDGTPLWYTDETRTETTGDVSQAAQSFTGKQALPIHTAGLSTSINYKGFVLSSQFTYAGGHSVYDRWGFVYNSDGAYAQLNTREEWANGAWTPENAGSATSPQVIYGGNNGSSTASTRYLYDADNIRWRSAELGYKFGKNILGDKTGLDNIYVYVKGYNLVVWTFDKDLWFDPEVATNDPAFYGIENMGMYNMTQPNLRQFIFGVRLDF